MKIWLDEGHGGAQPGACALGCQEKDLTLQIGNALEAELIGCGFMVNRTRTADVDVGLSARASRANQWGADYFVSVHLNAGGGQGAETWCSIVGGKSKALAQCIQLELVKLGYKDRDVKSRKDSDGRDYLAVIRETKMPAVLAEVGFIDSASDMALFDADKAAAAIAKGICSHTGIAYQSAQIPPDCIVEITGLSLDTKSKDMAAGERYTVLARCKDKPNVITVGQDVIRISQPRLDPKGRGWLIEIEGLPPAPAVRHGHIQVTADGVTRQCNFNVW